MKVPMPISVKLFANQCAKAQEEEEYMSHIPYGRVVGSLMYKMVCNRLKIEHKVGVLRKYMSKLGRVLWTTMKRVFKYLHGTTGYGLCYQRRLGLDRVFFIHGFVDGDWARDLDRILSTS